MTLSETNSWISIRDDLMRRIRDRVWLPGEQIPHEAALAVEFGCARTTVNRALRNLADKGLVVRKRKAGTRVALNPPQRATITIPIIREEVEAAGRRYRHHVIEQDRRPVPPALLGAFPVSTNARVLFVRALHYADERPYIFEERYINLDAVDGDIPLQSMSANEWLVQNAPYSHGELSFFGLSADRELSELFDTAVGTALFALERITWSDRVPITRARWAYEPGYRMRTKI